MVCTEYPPMQGGIGRYTHNLVKSLQANGVDNISVVSSSEGIGDYKGLSPFSKNNSQILLDIIEKMKPDIVHIQHEHGLYHFSLNPIFPFKSCTGIDEFYKKCKIPIVTTFHTAYPFSTWMQSVLIDGKDPFHIQYMYKFWNYLVNYRSLVRINRHAMSKSSANIVLSKYLTSLIPSSRVIYHGAEPFQSQEISQQEARKRLGLPFDKRIILVQGFITATKGWDVLRKIKIPDGWVMVINYSKNHYNKQTIGLSIGQTNHKNLINLGKNYLSEQDLSLLLFASDVVFLPYKAIAGSGTMFDGLAHGKPFLASNVGFFREFEEMDLGVIAERKAHNFENGIRQIERIYDKLVKNVMEFKKLLKWNVIAQQHIDVYSQILSKNEKRKSFGLETSYPIKPKRPNTQ